MREGKELQEKDILKAGINGWLIVLLIGFVLSTYVNARNFGHTLQYFLSGFKGQWMYGLDEGMTSGLMMFICYESIESIVVLCLYGIVLTWMLSKRIEFPKFTTMTLWIEVVLGFVSRFLIIALGLSHLSVNLPGFIGLIMRAVIWSIYLKQSRRVKLTFINQRKMYEGEYL